MALQLQVNKGAFFPSINLNGQTIRCDVPSNDQVFGLRVSGDSRQIKVSALARNGEWRSFSFKPSQFTKSKEVKLPPVETVDDDGKVLEKCWSHDSIGVMHFADADAPDFGRSFLLYRNGEKGREAEVVVKISNEH